MPREKRKWESRLEQDREWLAQRERQDRQKEAARLRRAAAAIQRQATASPIERERQIYDTWMR